MGGGGGGGWEWRQGKGGESLTEGVKMARVVELVGNRRDENMEWGGRGEEGRKGKRSERGEPCNQRRQVYFTQRIASIWMVPKAAGEGARERDTPQYLPRRHPRRRGVWVSAAVRFSSGIERYDSHVDKGVMCPTYGVWLTRSPEARHRNRSTVPYPTVEPNTRTGFGSPQLGRADGRGNHRRRGPTQPGFSVLIGP